jgi:hypothetical protein
MALPAIHRLRNEDEGTARRAAPTRTRKWLGRALGTLVFLGGLAGAYCWCADLAQKQLQSVVASLDQLDPGWQMEESDPQVSLPEEEKTRKAVTDAFAALPTNPPWPSQNLIEALQGHAPEIRLDEHQLALLRAEVRRTAAATEQARSLVESAPRAFRFNQTHTVDNLFADTSMQQARTLGQSLCYEATLHAHEGDPARAYLSIRAALRIGEMTGDSRLLMGSLIRIASRHSALTALEETLAQTEMPDALLDEMQRWLEEHERIPLLRDTLRGERAFHHRLFTRMETGEIKISQNKMLSWFGDEKEELPPAAFVYDQLGIPMVQHVHAMILLYLTELMQLTELPMPQWKTAFSQAKLPDAALPHFLLNMYPFFYGQLPKSIERDTIRMRCTMVALAAERHRLRTGAWPESLAALAPERLPDAWTDPYDDQPLRYLLLKDGVLIYSLGPSGVDSKGKIDRNNPTAPGANQGVRLWDPARRRQPPEVIGPVRKEP